jgi:hypothetical protein
MTQVSNREVELEKRQKQFDSLNNELMQFKARLDAKVNLLKIEGRE